VMLRWLLLHMAGHPQSKLSAAVAKQSINKDAVIRLLLDSAYLESWVRLATHLLVHSLKLYSHVFCRRPDDSSPD